MKKRFVLPATVLAVTAFVVATTVPADAATTFAIVTINMSNKQAQPQAIAVDSATGNLYVGQQDGPAGAKIAALSPTGQLRTYIRVGESFDPATNLPYIPEGPAPHAPSKVIALTINPNTNILIALVSSSWINRVPNYSHLSGSYVVTVNMTTNTVVKRYSVASFDPVNPFGLDPFDPHTMWTGFSLDIANNVLWGVEGYDPTLSNAVDRLNLTTGVQTRAALPLIEGASPQDYVPTIAFNRPNGRAYVSVGSSIFVIDSTLRVVSTLHVPGQFGCGVDVPAQWYAPGTAWTSIVASPTSNTIYVNYCGSIYFISGATNTVMRSVAMAGYGVGLALDAPAQSLYTYEIRNDVKGIAVYSSATTGLLKFIPLALYDVLNWYPDGNAWIANNPVLHKTYFPSSASAISGVVSR